MNEKQVKALSDELEVMIMQISNCYRRCITHQDQTELMSATLQTLKGKLKMLKVLLDA